MSSSNCCFLTCIQILQEVGKVVWYSHLLNNFPQVKQQGALPTENYAEDARHGPAYQNKTQFTPQSVSPIRKLPEASYPDPSEDGQNDTHNHRRLIKLITWTTALSNSTKLWAMPCGATQDRWVMVECSDKTQSTGEGNGKPLQYSCLENPKKIMEMQKDMTLKGELSMSVGAPYATWEE